MQLPSPALGDDQARTLPIRPDARHSCHRVARFGLIGSNANIVFSNVASPFSKLRSVDFAAQHSGTMPPKFWPHIVSLLSVRSSMTVRVLMIGVVALLGHVRQPVCLQESARKKLRPAVTA